MLPGYERVDWSQLHAGDWIYLAKSFGMYKAVVTRLEVIDPTEQTVRWRRREHYDYGRDADMIEVITPLSEVYRGGLTEWPGLIRLPLRRLDPEGFRRATQADMGDGFELYVWGTHNGRPHAYGPHDPYGTVRMDDRTIVAMRLRNRTNGRTFVERADNILVKE